MQFLLNDIPVQSPSVLLSTCEVNGLDTSLWVGKANSFTDCYGIDPSFGYFLVDNELAQQLTAISDNPNAGNGGGAYVVAGGSNKEDLTIKFDDGIEPRIVPDLYLESIINVTPSLSGAESFYLVKLVDARFVFNHAEAAKKAYRFSPSNLWYNRVETFLFPDQLKSEFELDSSPDLGYFIYDLSSTESYHINTPNKVTIGTKGGVDVKIDAPLNWEEIFTAIFTCFADVSRSGIDPVFPYWELNTYTLKLNFPEDIFPLWVPQNISLKDRTARDVIYELLFWSGTSIRYDGHGEFTFFEAVNTSSIVLGKTVTELDLYLEELYPTDIIHTSIVTASQEVPEGFSIHIEILDIERDDNEKQDHYVIATSLDEVEAPPTLPRGRRTQKIRLPICHIEERARVTSSGEQKILADAEYYGYIRTYLQSLYFKYFNRFPSVVREYAGYESLSPKPFLDRVSWFHLGGSFGTKVESKVPFDYDCMLPSPIIPRELKLSVIIAKVENEVPADAITFTFIEPKLLVGQLFNINRAYNTIKRSYSVGEEIVLVGGSLEEWRHSSLFLQNYGQDQLYFTIDDVPYLRLKIDKQYLEPLSSGSYDWKVLLDSVKVVNGKLPREDDEEESLDYIYIKNNPEVLLDEADEFLYISYDLQAGNDVYHRWTTADAQNDILFLKGLPGYVQNPEEPATGERRLVLKSPYSSTQPIGWLEEASDGRTDEELEEFVINIINEQGGSGGEGGNTTILKGLVNQAGGIASTDATLNWDEGIVIVSDGAVQPVSGTADNTFETPFLDNEPILLIRKNNGIWTAVKIKNNIIRGYPNVDVASNTTTFQATLTHVIEGTTPVSPITVTANGIEYMSQEPLCFKHGNDGRWHIISRYEVTAIFRTTGSISGASFNNTTGILTIGSGNASKMTCSTTNPSQYLVANGTSTTTIKNMTGSTISANKNIQCKRIGRHWFVDVEACS